VVLATSELGSLDTACLPSKVLSQLTCPALGKGVVCGALFVALGLNQTRHVLNAGGSLQGRNYEATLILFIVECCTLRDTVVGFAGRRAGQSVCGLAPVHSKVSMRHILNKSCRSHCTEVASVAVDHASSANKIAA
jgi:hypothetical protein